MHSLTRHQTRARRNFKPRRFFLPINSFSNSQGSFALQIKLTDRFDLYPSSITIVLQVHQLVNASLIRNAQLSEVLLVWIQYLASTERMEK